MGRVRGEHQSQNVSAAERRINAWAATTAGVKESSSIIYSRKWNQFELFGIDPKL